MGTFQEQLSLSVVIPALDAGETIAGLVAALAGSRLIGEIVVVDGGSRDESAALAAAAGARVVDAPRGRGTQLAGGAAAADGEWLLFLHADCRLEAGWEEAVERFLAMPGAAGRAGYFTLALDESAPAARRLERIVAWRCRFFALPYGDQGLLIARRLYEGVGGFRPLPLMEDVDLARRLGPRRLAPIGARIVASARRYRAGGYWRRPARNLFCLGLYFLGLSPARIARLYR
ncbi:MAG TPA: TIGR04283 family arsenosugar biosynthesis glycosyltransferase [Stellaceae bacterium]|nr:TIGR04283 family arsenosugar biosynthesis glycosyltransferase [Stellaceae bacterium]